MREQPAQWHSTIVMMIAQKANDPMWASQHTVLIFYSMQHSYPDYLQGRREGGSGGSGTPLEIFSIELVSQGHLQSHQPPVQHGKQHANICIHTYLFKSRRLYLVIAVQRHVVKLLRYGLLLYLITTQHLLRS